MLYSGVNEAAAGVTIACWIGLGVVMVATRQASGPAQPLPAKRDPRSMLGIALQGLGIGAAWFGPMSFDMGPVALATWIAAAPAIVLAIGSFGLFFWSAAAMGQNWSLVARTRADHTLVQDGPFALMRHPIYTALFGLMAATALATGHAINLLVAIPFYVLGTLQRVVIEEKLLREAFGDAYDAYARKVKRFIPAIW